MTSQPTAHTCIASCDLGAVSQQTDKHITAAVVHQVQVQAPPRLDLDQAFCHTGYSGLPWVSSARHGPGWPPPAIAALTFC